MMMITTRTQDCGVSVQCTGMYGCTSTGMVYGMYGMRNQKDLFFLPSRFSSPQKVFVTQSIIWSLQKGEKVAVVRLRVLVTE
jgi:hypothetical protein